MIFQRASLLIFLLPFAAFAEKPQFVGPLDTTQPNQFYFTSDVYYVNENSTNAVIEVGFVPGDRSFSGSVLYQTLNGTAQAGKDFTGVTNTLVFSGPGPTKTFTIPVQTDLRIEGDETVQLMLSNSNAFITRSTATLIIIDKTPPPKLDLARTNGSMIVSWATNYSNFALEKNTNLATTNWVSVPQSPAVANGRYNVTTQLVGNVFFRLNWLTNAP